MAWVSDSAKGRTPCGLIWRVAPVSVTTGVAQNGQRSEWVSGPNSILAPQLGQLSVRMVCAMVLPASIRRPCSSGISVSVGALWLASHCSARPVEGSASSTSSPGTPPPACRPGARAAPGEIVCRCPQ